MVAASSNFFRANLGHLDEDLLGRLHEWAQRNFSAHHVPRNSASVVVLRARCPGEPRTRKSFGMAMPALCKNWKVPLDLRGDWLELLSEAEYEASAAAVEHGAISTAPEGVLKKREQCADTGERVRIITRSELPDDFVERSLEMWRHLHNGAAPCAT